MAATGAASDTFRVRGLGPGSRDLGQRGVGGGEPVERVLLMPLGARVGAGQRTGGSAEHGPGRGDAATRTARTL